MKNKEKFHYFLHMIRTKVILLFAAVMTLMLTLLMIFGYRLERLFLERLVDANRGLLQYYAGIMESEFNAAELFFVEQRLQQSVYLHIENDQSELDQYLAAYEVRKIFDHSLHETGCLNSIFLYSPESDTFVQCSYGLDHAAEQTLAASMLEQIRNGQVTTARWTQLPVGQSQYLYYIIPIHNSWIGGLADMEALLEQIDLEEIDLLQAVVLLDGSFQPVSGSYGQQDAVAIQAAVETGRSELFLGGKSCMISQAVVQNGMFYLAGLTEKNIMQGQVRTERLVLLAGAVALLGLGIGLVVLLWRSLVRPLSNITDGMLELQKGNFSYQLNEEKSSEFAQITTTFNEMGREIERLKIAAYEDRLERQKTELQFLQSQLNPHFLINCLNNLRTLVLQERLPEFQTMLIELGTYLRGAMTMQKLIPLEQEIKNVTAYVGLQKIRYQDRFQVELHVYGELLPILVPVHIIQTFVENAIKYGLSSERRLNIEITGDLSDAQDNMLVLTILDDGPGFTPEVLDQLRRNSPVIKDGRECIGITNAAMRMRLLFGETASIVCCNRKSGRACVQIKIPIQEGELW